MTIDVITDRIRSICASAPFGYTEAVSWTSFDLQPTTNIDGVFRIPPPSSQSVNQMFGFAEERTDTVQIWVARKINADYDAARRRLLVDMHSLTAAIARDAFEISGDYNVLSEGRGHAVTPEKQNAEYVSLRLTIPVNYDAQL
jgi:hypothetical protein